MRARNELTESHILSFISHRLDFEDEWKWIKLMNVIDISSI